MTRKPAGSETGRRSRLPLPDVRKLIWEQACDLAAAGTPQELSAILARRFGLSERIIDLTILAEGMKYQRACAALRTGVIAALEQAREAITSVDSDINAA
ncbi:MAG: hypothetical protein JWO19_4486 [Bryobacterales bacterium]|jgi:hypothetical protein|nr:hypothetical protein [Bryobacterales bacterium]